LQAKDAYVKYVNQMTTSSTWIDEAEGLEMPFITLCPGFRPSVFDQVEDRFFPHLLNVKGRVEKNVTEQEIDEWFREHTYDLAAGMKTKFHVL
jgi:hypothetical protein